MEKAMWSAHDFFIGVEIVNFYGKRNRELFKNNPFLFGESGGSDSPFKTMFKIYFRLKISNLWF